MKLEVLQVGRALAALAVVAHHTASHGTAYAAPMPELLKTVLMQAYLGVDFFFVLSGFIIFHTTVGRVGDAASLMRYVRQRATRIYLPYWPIGLGLACLYMMMPGFEGSGDHWSWLESITLLPLGQGSTLAVVWTLKHEVMFYIIFGVGLLLGRPLTVFGAWMSVVALSMVLLPWPEPFAPGWREVLQAPINLEFGMGVAAALWFRSRRSIPSVAYAVGVVGPLALWLALGTALGSLREVSFLVGLSLAVAVAWSATLERSGAIASPRWLVFLGDASYSIYLIHYPIMSLTSRLADTWWQAFLGGIAASLVAGIAYHLTVERSLLNASKGQGLQLLPSGKLLKRA